MRFIERALDLEPALVISTVSGILLLATHFGVETSDLDVPTLVMAGFNLLVIVGTVLGIRQSVYSPATHEREVAEAEGDFIAGG